MKNALTASQGTAAVSEPWRQALRTFDQDLQRRGAADRTRKAYGTDAAELAAWATANRLDPTEVDYKALRTLGRPALARRARPRARWPASSRARARSSASLLEHGHISANPADLLPAPKLPHSLPKTLKPQDIATLLDKIPAGTPLEQRDRALFELAYSQRPAEPRNWSIWTPPSIDFDQEQVRVEGKGSKTRFVPVGEQALKLDRHLSGACATRAAVSRTGPRAVSEQIG